MGNRGSIRLVRERVSQGLALFCLLAMGGWVLFGPSGLMAWSENNRMLAERQKELQQLNTQRDELKNRVALLDPNHVDPDMAGQLLRAQLNVVHPDEMVMLLH
jgi:cell division protein FtsB